MKTPHSVLTFSRLFSWLPGGRQRALMESTTVGLLTVDKTGVVTWCEPRLAAYLGYSRRDLVHQLALKDLVVTEDADDLLALINDHPSGEGFCTEARFLRCGRESIPCLVSGRGQLLSFTDLTRLKAADSARSQSQKLESLGYLAAGIAHDFNNLLAGIYGYVELARSTNARDKTGFYLAKTLGTLERARSLTQQLLTFSKGGSPEARPGSLFPFVTEICQQVLRGATVEFESFVPEDIWWGSFDQVQMMHVIQNLMLNSREAIPETGKVTLEAANRTLGRKEHPVLSAGNYLVLTFRDSGTGIPKDVLEHVLDPFFTTKGTCQGLGLSTAFSIMKKHSGWLSIDSTLGKGTTVVLWLPGYPASERPQPEAPPRKRSRGGTLLIMDDESMIREVLTAKLTAMGYEVICAANGLEAIAAFTADRDERKQIQGVLLDLTIPGLLGGTEVCEHLRRIDQTVPILVASGYANDPVMASPERYGFQASIIKPYMDSELQNLLEKHLHGNQGKVGYGD